MEALLSNTHNDNIRSLIINPSCDSDLNHPHDSPVLPITPIDQISQLNSSEQFILSSNTIAIETSLGLNQFGLDRSSGQQLSSSRSIHSDKSNPSTEQQHTQTTENLTALNALTKLNEILGTNTAVSWSHLLYKRVLSKYSIVDVDFIPFTSSNRETRKPHYPTAEKGDLQLLLQQHNLKRQTLPITTLVSASVHNVTSSADFGLSRAQIRKRLQIRAKSCNTDADTTNSITNENQSPFKPSRRITTRHSNSFIPLPAAIASNPNLV